MNVQERIEVLEKQLQELKNELEQKNINNLITMYEPYFYIDVNGDVICDVWTSDRTCKSMLEIGNVFKTEEDVKFMVERLKVLAELKKLSRPFVFDDNHDNYGICYDHCISKITIYIEGEDQYNIYYFDTAEEAKAAIDKIGEDRLKKYYFGIGEEK